MRRPRPPIGRASRRLALPALILALTMILVLASAVPALAAYFEDVDGHPYEASILTLADRGIINGYGPDSFGPNDLVTRQQFAKMIVKTLDLTVTGAEVCPFGDVSTSAGTDPFYPAKYVAVCAANNITKGKDATHFAPYDTITRQQVITMVVRAADNLAPSTLAAVPDGWSGLLSYGDPTHGANVKKAEYNGLLDGIWASSVEPTVGGLAGWNTGGYATRGEVAEMLAQLLYRTGKILTVTGPTGTVELSMAELKALTPVEGYGGYKNQVGTLVGPMQLKGVAIQTLMGLVGGGTTVTAIASDDYEAAYDADLVSGTTGPGSSLVVYDPTTGDEIPAYAGTITMILAYEVHGADLPSDWGALRVVFVSPTADQLTYSGKWARQIVTIEAQ